MLSKAGNSVRVDFNLAFVRHAHPVERTNYIAVECVLFVRLSYRARVDFAITELPVSKVGRIRGYFRDAMMLRGETRVECSRKDAAVQKFRG